MKLQRQSWTRRGSILRDQLVLYDAKMWNHLGSLHWIFITRQMGFNFSHDLHHIFDREFCKLLLDNPPVID